MEQDKMKMHNTEGRAALIGDLSVLQIIQAEMAEITDALVESQGSKLEPVDEKAGEKVLGRAHNLETRKLHVAAVLFKTRALQMEIAERLAIGEQEIKTAHAEHIKLEHIADFTRELFWVQIMDDIDMWEYSKNVGIRVGWQVVSTTPQTLGDFIQRITGR